MSDLSGRTVVITGGSRGIGLEVARACLAAHCEGVVITGRKAEHLAKAVAELADERVHPVEGAVTDDDHLAAVMADAVEHFGSCDVLVNNAGQNVAGGMLMDVELSRVDRTWAVNMRAPLVAARAAWHAWMKDNGGVVVNIASTAGLAPAPFLGAYGVAKAGVVQLTRQLASELAPKVRVNAVAPGVVQTDFSAPLLEMIPHGWDRVHPLGRIGQVTDVASAVVFLASPDADWITGAVLPVDGGATGATSAFSALR